MPADGRNRPLQIDIPEVKAEVEAAFAAYEQALTGNDVAALDRFFLDRPTTIRYGGGENLYGYAAIAAFRAARSPANLARTLERTIVTTYGTDFAVASTLFRRKSAPGLPPSPRSCAKGVVKPLRVEIATLSPPRCRAARLYGCAACINQ